MTSQDKLPPDVRELLDFIREKIVEGLQHGFFEYGIKCDTERKGLRAVVVDAGSKHKFNIPENQVPK